MLEGVEGKGLKKTIGAYPKNPTYTQGGYRQTQRLRRTESLKNQQNLTFTVAVVSFDLTAVLFLFAKAMEFP